MNRFAVFQRVMGLLLMIFSFSNVPPLFVSLYYQDGSHGAFATAFCITLITGFIIWSPVRRATHDLKLRDGFLIVVAFWFVLGLFGAIPLYLSEQPQLSFTDAAFESISGMTTTGATVIVGLDHLPRGILYHRQQLQWLGGMGIIVLAVAILPMLGVGGMQLYRAETPGPMKDSKLTPRITETAKALWLIYLGLTIVCALCYWLAGMELFDAIGHAFSTVSTGGYSTHDASMGHFNSATIELIAVAFMFLCAVNFSLHFTAWRSASLRAYFGDPEFRSFLFLTCAVTLVCTAYLLFQSTYTNVGTAFVKSVFQVMSIGTSTGYTTADFAHWPTFLPMMLLLGSFVGGCAGSTAGGIKVIRILLLAKQGIREINRLIHPNAEIPVKLGNKVVSSHVVQAVWGYFAAYMSLYAMMYLVLLSTGLDEVTAFSAVAACLNNLGPGLGEVAGNFAVPNDLAKWVLIGAMLLGRLEIFTLLVVFSPMFWRK